MDGFQSRDEMERLHGRPVREGTPSRLSSFVVEVIGNLNAYASRIRVALAAGVEFAAQGQSDAEELSESNVPVWFSAACREKAPALDSWPEVLEGRRRYIEHCGEEPWDLQDWLWEFASGTRQWSWWDVTAAGGSIAQIWIDSNYEPNFQADDVRWLAYASGARAVVGPIFLPSSLWEGQMSLGL
ncbi:hypothetical protein [Sphaerimonospora thailandensis]|uniref:Uncharacterized protein n=1 Tax=Sphaerimonospora thailandensis TaxID=795644 RepID=A0A8J3RCB2_9ACTN|nr:hypothetical protein [Sphaerimonospora thailandensis]GIH73496.1 hypothetical protein Mth01_57490 [Sphaerimonospora thailandensis]